MSTNPNPGFALESWCLYGFGVAAVALRILSRAKRAGLKNLQIDDYFVIFGLVSYTILCVAFNEMLKGAGSNLMTDEEVAALTPEIIRERVKGSKWVFVSEHGMLLTIWSMKAAMLVLYARITEGLMQRKILNGVIVWVVLSFVGDELALFTICRPLSQYWAVPPENSQCSTYFIYQLVNSGFNISTDLMLLVIGLPPVLKARLSLQQKLILAVVFGMGSFVIIAAILRAIYCTVPSLVSYVYMNWYFREASVAVYVTNAPAIWVLLRDMFPGLQRLGHSTRRTTSGKRQQYGDSHGVAYITSQSSAAEVGHKSWMRMGDNKYDRELKELDEIPINKGAVSTTVSRLAGSTSSDFGRQGSNEQGLFEGAATAVHPVMMSHKFAPLKNDRILRAAKGQSVDRPPMWVMRQAGRYLPEYHEAKGKHDFFECCRSPEIASTLTLQPIDRYDGFIDAAIIFSDILVIPQAMGMEVNMVDKVGPQFPNPLRSPQDQQFADVLSKHVDVESELDYVYKAITLTRQKLNGRVPLIGFCGAPWTLLCYMVEGGGTKLFREAKTWVYKYGEDSKKLLQKISDICVEYLVLQVEAGAQMLQVFDSWAGELSPTSFQIFSLPYLRHISKRTKEVLQERGLDIVPMTVFAKGAWYGLDQLCDSGYDVVGLDWLHDPAEAVKVARGRVTLQGNADPGVLYGSDESITKVVEHAVAGFGGGKQRWIVNLGHGITPGVDPMKLKFFFEEIVRCTK